MVKGLVVEDDKSVRELVAALLRDRGFQIEEAESGERALELFKSGKRFDFVLADMELAGMSGWDLYELAVRVNIDLSDRFLFWTRHIFDELAKPAIAAGKIVLGEPILPDELYRKVFKIIGEKKTA